MQTARAERVPLDLYVMFDSSLSMTSSTGVANITKWTATKTAMTAFLNDPMSAGLGVGLQFFPLVKPGVPDECLMDAQCGASGPCHVLRGCLIADKLCETNADCPMRGDRCELLGACQLSDRFCLPVGGLCPNVRSMRNPCLAFPGYCRGRDLCDAAAYATPAVAIAPLPGAAQSLIAALNAKMPDGLTPTGPALAGALQHAQERARKDPGRRVAVVFATDGLPVECTPTDTQGIAALARTAASGMPAIPTFVIGVFSPDPAEQQAATMNLGAIAQAGGTKRAFIINTEGNVAQAFQAALNEIRTQAIACEYKIPPPTMGKIDFGKVNVEIRRGTGQSTTLAYVGDKAACTDKGGWYYDTKPTAGQSPTTIVACDATCTQLRAEPTVQVNIVLGCETLIIL
jgi:hypothetical protein